MAALYGRLQGNRGEATRTGSAASGIKATLETWEGKVRVDLDADGSYIISIMGKHDEDRRQIATGNVNARTFFPGATLEHWELASKDARLGVGHVWTNTQCPAYRTMDPRDCVCSNRETSTS